MLYFVCIYQNLGNVVISGGRVRVIFFWMLLFGYPFILSKRHLCLSLELEGLTSGNVEFLRLGRDRRFFYRFLKNEDIVRWRNDGGNGRKIRGARLIVRIIR